MEKEKRTTILASVPVYLLEDLRNDILSIYNNVDGNRGHLQNIYDEIREDLATILGDLNSIISTYREDIDYEKAKKIITAYYLNDSSYFYTPEDLENAQTCIGIGLSKGELEINIKES